jgi:8-oxo-dGTP diphosphatase
MSDSIARNIDFKYINDASFSRCCVGCLVLSQDRQIVLQLRDVDCKTYPGHLATFGGGIDAGESPMQALVRELKEELGAEVKPQDVISLGTLVDTADDHKELVYLYFWHDRSGSITGCYEGKAKYYNDPVIPQRHPRVMNDVCWLLQECEKKGLLK